MRLEILLRERNLSRFCWLVRQDDMDSGGPGRTGRLGRLETGPDTEVLVVRAREGEPWAADALFRRHAPRVMRVATVLLGRSAEVDDIVQDTFVQALLRLSSLQEPSAFEGWVTRIAANKCRTLLRRRGLLRRLGLDRGEEDQPLDRLSVPGLSPEDRSELTRIASVLEELDAETRVAWTLRRVEGWGLEEVASTVHASLATVKRRIASADAQLKAHAEDRRRRRRA